MTTLVLATDDPVLVDVRERVRAICASAQALVVDSDERKLLATDLLGRFAGVKREAEARRVDLVKPHNDHVKGINDLFRDALAPLTEADRIVRGRVLAFDQDQRRIAAEAAAAAERQRLEAEALLREAERAEASGNVGVAEGLLNTAVAREESAKASASTSIAPPTATRAESGTASVRRIWTFRVIDEQEIPRKYLVLDEARVRADIREGARTIAGLEIYQDEQLAVRR